jgi:hypothetical protein
LGIHGRSLVSCLLNRLIDDLKGDMRFNVAGRAPEESEVQHIEPVTDQIPTYIAALIEKLPEPDELLKLPGLQIDFVFVDDAQSG